MDDSLYLKIRRFFKYVSYKGIERKSEGKRERMKERKRERMKERKGAVKCHVDKLSSIVD